MKNPILSTLDRCETEDVSFRYCWLLTTDRFPGLQEICGGFALVFLNTATVELCFSIIDLEKNANQKSLTDYCLEGILHSKQWKELHSLLETNRVSKRHLNHTVRKVSKLVSLACIK